MVLFSVRKEEPGKELSYAGGEYSTEVYMSSLVNNINTVYCFFPGQRVPAVLTLGSPACGETWALFCCFSLATSKKLDHKWDK